MKRDYTQLVFALVIGCLCAIQTYSVYAQFLPRSEYLYWDPSAHAFYGVKIAVDLQHLDVLQLLSDANEQTLWPPLHSFLQVPFQLLAGPGFYAAALASLFCYALFFLALTFLFQQLKTDFFGWIVMMAFAVASPIYSGFASMPMLEIFGATMTAWSAALYLRNSRWFPLSLALLFFLKYNYCLYLALPVLALQFREFPRSRKFWIPLCGGVLILGILHFLGYGLGNPLTVLCWLLLIYLVAAGHARNWWRKIRGTGWEWFWAPVLIWMLIPIPNRFRTLFQFAVNEPLGGYSAWHPDYYLFYFRQLPSYFSDVWPALLCAGMAVAAVVWFRKTREVVFLGLLFALPFLLMTANQNKQDRFLFTFVFALWALAGCLVSKIDRKPIRFAAAFAICALVFSFYHLSAANRWISWQFAPGDVRGPVNFIASEAASERDVRIVGVSNELNKSLLLYHIYRESNFEHLPHVEWTLEEKPQAGELVITINAKARGYLRKEKPFGDYVIRTYRTR